MSYIYDKARGPLSSAVVRHNNQHLSLQTTLVLNRRCVFAAGPAPQGAPDGLCLDNKDGVWSARWQDGRLLHYNPSGKILDIIVFPKCWNITSCVFGGM
jgi:sugar lactone lactonase YvrE